MMDYEEYDEGSDPRNRYSANSDFKSCENPADSPFTSNVPTRGSNQMLT